MSPPVPFALVALFRPAKGRNGSHRVTEEVVAYPVGLMGSTVTVTLEIEAGVPDGMPDNVVRLAAIAVIANKNADLSGGAANVMKRPC